MLWSGRDDRKPNHDLPNQEKNQYWTVYWQGTDQEWSEDLSERGERKLASDGQNKVGIKMNNGSLFERN